MAHTFEAKCSFHINVFGFFLSNSVCEHQLLNYLLKNSMCREVLTDLNFKVNQDLGAVCKHSHYYVQKPQYCCFIVPIQKKEGNTPFHIHVCRLFLPRHLIPLSEVGLDLLQKSFASKTLVLYCMQTVEVWVSLAPLCSLGFHPQMFVVFKLLTVLTKASPMPVKAHRWERDNCKLYILCFEMINPRLCLSWQLR